MLSGSTAETSNYPHSANRAAEQLIDYLPTNIQLLILLSLSHNNGVLDPNTKQVKLCTAGLLYVTIGAIIYQTNVVLGVEAAIVREQQYHQFCQHLRQIARRSASY